MENQDIGAGTSHLKYIKLLCTKACFYWLQVNQLLVEIIVGRIDMQTELEIGQKLESKLLGKLVTIIS